MSTPQLIGLDWGTTSCRAYLIGADGAVLERVADGPGILKVENGAFGAALDAMIGAWPKLPVILSGMVGSRQGWKEALYATCPAYAEYIARNLARIEWGELTIAIVPGLRTENGRMPDVMRGEETQIFGALALSSQSDGLFLLPGTHSKWAEVQDNHIVSFRTFMTGEVFGALKEHTILGRLMREAETSGQSAFENQRSFIKGVYEGASLNSGGALLNYLFATRTYGLMNELPETALADYLSGLLIGAEVAEATGRTKRTATIVATRALAARYQNALQLLEHEVTFAPEDCVAAGHWRIARAAGLC